MDLVNYWIVGASGLLGSYLSASLKNSIASTKTEADITNLDSLKVFLQKHPQITHIINCSAYSMVDLAEKEKEKAHLVNAIGPENLGKMGKDIGAKVLHISTDYVFPGTGALPLQEDDQVGPLNFYGQTKLEGEKRLLDVLPSACIVRTSALFGKGGKNFVAKLRGLFSEQKKLSLVDDQINCPTCVEDLAKALHEIRDLSGIFHFANKGVATKFTFASELFALLSLDPQKVELCPVSHLAFPTLCPRPTYSVLDTRKIEKHLSFPIRSWQNALAEFITQKERL